MGRIRLLVVAWQQMELSRHAFWKVLPMARSCKAKFVGDVSHFYLSETLYGNHKIFIDGGFRFVNGESCSSVVEGLARHYAKTAGGRH
jgi:hypothetical protein